MDLHDFLVKFDHGAPDVDELGRGMHACYANALSLLNDARRLLDASPARAISLAVLAWEETGKIFLLAEAVAKVTLRRANWEALRKDLRLQSHPAKQAALAGYGKTFLEPLRKKACLQGYTHDIPEKIVPLLDKFKQLGFYVDLFEGKFIAPQQFGPDNRQWADWLISACSERLDSIRSMHQSEEDSLNTARRISDLVRQASQAKSQEGLRAVIRSFMDKNHAA